MKEYAYHVRKNKNDVEGLLPDLIKSLAELNNNGISKPELNVKAITKGVTEVEVYVANVFDFSPAVVSDSIKKILHVERLDWMKGPDFTEIFRSDI